MKYNAPMAPNPAQGNTVAGVRVVPAHGTRARYVHRTLSCRCSSCRSANAKYIARHRAGIWAPTRFRQLTIEDA